LPVLGEPKVYNEILEDGMLSFVLMSKAAKVARAAPKE
jgi:hypothetical protein